MKQQECDHILVRESIQIPNTLHVLVHWVCRLCPYSTKYRRKDLGKYVLQRLASYRKTQTLLKADHSLTFGLLEGHYIPLRSRKPRGEVCRGDTNTIPSCCYFCGQTIRTIQRLRKHECRKMKEYLHSNGKYIV